MVVIMTLSLNTQIQIRIEVIITEWCCGSHMGVYGISTYVAVLHAPQLQSQSTSTVLQPIQQRLLLSKFPGTNS